LKEKFKKPFNSKKYLKYLNNLKKIATMLGQRLDSANVESLLGLPPGQQQLRMSSEQPLQQLDLSFMDVFHQQQQQHINRNYLGGGNSMLSQPPNSH